jgi:hypothetical protein
MRRSFFDIYFLTIGASKIHCAIDRDIACDRSREARCKEKDADTQVRSVHGLTVEPPSLHVADKESRRRDRWCLPEVCQRSSWRPQAGF